MAKVIFQDEQGQNLNRYVLTPVEGQANTYDLTRAATITQQGTPYSKEVGDHFLQVEDGTPAQTLACAKTDTTYTLTGLSATSGKVPVMFSVPTAFAAGDTVTIDGTAYGLATRDGSALTTGAWAAGKVITGTADVDNHKLYVGPSGVHKSTLAPTTLTAAGWTGSAAPYSQALSIAAVTATSANELLPGASITADQLAALQAANIQDGGQAAGSITLLAYGDKPSIDLPVRIIVRGDL